VQRLARRVQRLAVPEDLLCFCPFGSLAHWGVPDVRAHRRSRSSQWLCRLPVTLYYAQIVAVTRWDEY
jgi:hypothetical protein